MRWEGRRDERVSYLRVQFPRESNGWSCGLLAGEFGMFTGGSIELSADSALGASGSLSYTGAAKPDPSDMVRVVYSCTDEDGERHEEALGTFLLALGDPSHDMGAVEGSADLLSVLHVAERKLFPRPYVIGRGCNCVERARQLVESLHLRVSAAWSGRLLRRDIVMEAGESYLDAANRLLAAAGFRPCEPDAYGGVVMRPSCPAMLPSWEFAEGADGIMEPRVTEHDGLSGAPNAVHLEWADDGFSAYASAVNDDPASPSSVRNLGYEDGVFEQADNPEGETPRQVLDSVMAQAAERLASACAGYSTCSLAHPWVPVGVGDRVRVSYPSAGIDFAGDVSSMKLSWDAKSHVRAETVVGRAVSAAFSPRVTGGVM